MYILYVLQSPQYSSGSYDSVKMELSTCGDDMTPGRSQVIDDDDDDHDDHDDSDKINDAEGLDPERLKAFNVRLTPFTAFSLILWFKLDFVFLFIFSSFMTYIA